ncbi:MAG: bifunctional 4-hydroxy-2-oxoglutarate aldolase/2-dehydro-3-deoxy-phosphogluconate aldolase [Planctomycetota bacterium]|jgi:2-dehydro-3-deoxyphosphogluconate aldolase/(4S)-4-hydroxy-2-oxoglutarate aldolase|nr:bifunctional 4-hydroxy-2-oxoglutarate aldolase/2-dehydro-3-deoxy-phosphogluconate aldolase [Planctomycetota bacterium]
MDWREKFRQSPALAILRNIPLEKTVPYAQAIFAGGIRLFEVAMNSANGLEQIGMIRRHFGDSADVGAGTVLSEDMALAARDAGASFMLAPSCPVEMLDWCRKSGTPFLPGVLTPTEACLCLSRGFSTMKLFPAGDMPMSYVRSLKGPLDQSEYVAIGGVTPTNAPEFIRAGYLGVGLGGGLVPKSCLEESDWIKAETAVRNMIVAMKAAR